MPKKIMSKEEIAEIELLKSMSNPYSYYERAKRRSIDAMKITAAFYLIVPLSIANYYLEKKSKKEKS